MPVYLFYKYEQNQKWHWKGRQRQQQQQKKTVSFSTKTLVGKSWLDHEVVEYFNIEEDSTPGLSCS